MEPIPETLETLRELAKYGDSGTMKALRRMSLAVAGIVPELVGLSLAVVADGLTFTLVESHSTAADLDAVQYLDGGPCVDAAATRETRTYHAGNVLDESTWDYFARAATAQGVASTLSLPIIREGRVVAGVNLYASTVDAFDTHHRELADACGGWEPGIVANADLEFRTRTEATRAPGLLHDEQDVNTALGVLAVAQGIDVDEATRRLEQAAARANISLARAARAVLPIFSPEP